MSNSTAPKTSVGLWLLLAVSFAAAFVPAGTPGSITLVIGLMPVGGTIICNGYKDNEYIRLALTGEKLGMQVAFRAGVPTGGDVAYMDTHGAMPGFIELIQTNPLMERIFAGWHGQALAWDGSDPVRPFM